MVVQLDLGSKGCGFDSHSGYMKFFKDVLEFDGDGSNFKVGFKELTSKYGSDYISFCRAMWYANDGIFSEEEFMKINGNMPRGFFEKVIKAGVAELV